MKRMEEELQARTERLRQSEARYRAVVEALVEGIIYQEADGTLTAANSAAERVLGLTLEELTGRVSTDPRWRAFDAEGNDLPGDEHPPMVALRTGQPQRDVVMGVHQPDGTRVWLSVNSQPLFHPETGAPQGVVTSFFDITAQREAQQELQARAAREALLNRIGEALRLAPSPEAVQEAAISLLGEALGADRCYFAVYDLGRGVVTLARDWHRPDLKSIQGVYPFPNTAEMFRELYHGARTSVISDAYASSLSAQTIANMESLGLRARISVALADGEDLMATLTAAMAEEPREWTAEEVALVEAVGTQLRTAVEMTRIMQREHRIAEQLQTALQPETPESVPGLALAAYYRPAWVDQGVGGDFSDVFAADKGITYLIVGDLSGKGLAAASQVATVRNMLRFALLNGRTVAGPITTLNHTLAEYELLTGFATLFVGRYDAEACTFTYVNCGQDAGLVLRASTGRVEPLPPTGPVLGAISGAVYTEKMGVSSFGRSLPIIVS